jgi:hypothetical protein
MKYKVLLFRIPIKGEPFELPNGVLVLQGLDDRTDPTRFMRVRVAIPKDNLDNFRGLLPEIVEE